MFYSNDDALFFEGGERLLDGQDTSSLVRRPLKFILELVAAGQFPAPNQSGYWLQEDVIKWMFAGLPVCHLVAN